jgi:hypothetical protein
MVTYPIPKIEDLHVALRGCKIFSILDMSQAYHQIPVAKDSQKWLTINTHLGLFNYKRIPNGIHSGPGIFQKIMDTVLAGVPKVICYLDDILVAGEDTKDHLRTLSLVFGRLQNAGFKLNKSKCQFEKSSVTYLAHRIDADGLHPTDSKLRAIANAPTPENVTQLKSFLGLLMFYSRFLPHHSSVLAPLNELLRRDVPWRWSKKEDQAFNSAKTLLLESDTLVHYDDKLQLYLSCDASSYGAGAVLSHCIDGQFRPIAFASCSLTKAQRNYSQLDKEAFSIIFGLKRFHQFLYGRSFTIITDHKPLHTLFSPTKPVPVHCAARLQRWALILASYNYSLEYRSTSAHSDADLMSRLPLPSTWDPVMENSDCYFLDGSAATAITHDIIKKATSADPTLSTVLRYIQDGWPTNCDSSVQPYKTRKNELTIEQGCVLWGVRVIVPPALQKDILAELHETHLGIVKMKMYARSYVWWPNLDAQIEEVVSTCELCQTMRAEPATAQVHPWAYPTTPWFRVHIDFAGPINGSMYLVVVDSYSKFPEIVKMSSTTSTSTVHALRDIFSRHGLPSILVSDNGPQLTSTEFKTFCHDNGIIHRTCAVHKPASNGQAERVVQVLKSAVKQAKLSNSDIDTIIAKNMLVYRNTPHSTTGEAPAKLLMGRKLRTRLDLIKPSMHARVERSQENVASRSEHRGCRKFYCGDPVLARNYGSGEKWMTGVVVEILGNKHYVVEVNGQFWKRHIDQLLHRTVSQAREEETVEIDSKPTAYSTSNVVMPNCAPYTIPSVPQPTTENQAQVDPPNTVQSQDAMTKENVNVPDPKSKTLTTQKTDDGTTSVARRNPLRDHKQPSYLKDFAT